MLVSMGEATKVYITNTHFFAGYFYFAMLLVGTALGIRAEKKLWSTINSIMDQIDRGVKHLLI